MKLESKVELYIRRSIDLAYLGKGYTSPNPNVGSVIQYKDRIIGEGYHMIYGGPHAEVNAVNSVKPADHPLLEKSKIYVSLEPCNIFGKTPPCSDLILKKEIPSIFISSADKTPGVDGLSISKLKNAGRKVISGIMAEEGNKLARIRNTFVLRKRPYIIIKFAVSQDGFIGKENEAVWLTNPISKRLVHKWRHEASSILVGTNTALTDNPQLTNRLYYGNSPLRIVLDRTLRLPTNLALFDGQQPTWVISEKQGNSKIDNTSFLQIPFDKKLLPKLLHQLWKHNHDTLIVEGGARLINSFIEAGLWDEVRMFRGAKPIGDGIKGPVLDLTPSSVFSIGSDKLFIFENNDVL